MTAVLSDDGALFLSPASHPLANALTMRLRPHRTDPNNEAKKGLA